MHCKGHEKCSINYNLQKDKHIHGSVNIHKQIWNLGILGICTDICENCPRLKC